MPEKQRVYGTPSEAADERVTVNVRSLVPEFPSFSFAGALTDRVTCACASGAGPKASSKPIREAQQRLPTPEGPPTAARDGEESKTCGGEVAAQWLPEHRSAEVKGSGRNPDCPKRQNAALMAVISRAGINQKRPFPLDPHPQSPLGAVPLALLAFSMIRSSASGLEFTMLIPAPPQQASACGAGVAQSMTLNEVVHDVRRSWSKHVRSVSSVSDHVKSREIQRCSGLDGPRRESPIL